MMVVEVVADTKENDAVVFVFPIVIAQLVVLREAEIEISTTAVAVPMPETIVAVAVTTSQFTRIQEPWLLPITQFTEDFPAGGDG